LVRKCQISILGIVANCQMKFDRYSYGILTAYKWPFVRHVKTLPNVLMAFGLLLVCSCGDKPGSADHHTEGIENAQTVVIDEDKIVFEDPFAAQPLNSENWATSFADFSVERSPIENTFRQELVDTILTLSRKSDTLYLYKGSALQFFYAMRINSDRIRLDKNIRLGMPKSEFFHAFNQLDTIRTQRDTVIVWMTESSIKFLFVADTLSRITWDSGGYE